MARNPLWLSTFLVLLLSGCASGPGTEADGSSDGQETGGPTTDAGSPDSGAGRGSRPGSEKESDSKTVEIYSFDGRKVGTSPPSEQSGPAVEQLPPEYDTFTAPPGTLSLDVEVSWPWATGICYTRVEILDEAGEEVYHGYTHTTAGAAGFSAGSTHMNEWTKPGLGAGEYTVVYYVAGVCDFGAWVQAVLPHDAG